MRRSRGITGSSRREPETFAKRRTPQARTKAIASLTSGALAFSAFAALAGPATADTSRPAVAAEKAQSSADAISLKPAAKAGGPTITPNPAYKSDPFEGWGTSLVWFANATGEYPDEIKEDLRDKLFSDEGLNLNIARYNVGGGDASDVPPYLRPGGAVPGWWNPDLEATDSEGEITSNYDDRDRYRKAWDSSNPEHYNFDADQAQRWWLEHIKDDVTHFEAFSNSPPYFLTESGFVSGGINNATSEQLAPENMDAFADYMVNVTEFLENEYGVDFKTIDPFNEPNTDYWSADVTDGDKFPNSNSRQEGAHIGPDAQNAMIHALSDRLAQPGTTTSATISAMDETNPGTFLKNVNAYDQASKDAVGQYNVHSYGQGSSLGARDFAKSQKTPLWMSEVEGDWVGGGGFDPLNQSNGLGLSKHLTDDLRNLEPSAWVFWQPVEDTYNMEKVENLNWGTVFVDFDCDADGNSARRLKDGDADPSCKVQTNAKYNTFRNFSHYILPGDQLIPSGNTNTAAALSQDGDAMNAVYTNEGGADTVSIDLSRFENFEGATVTPIVTTAPTSLDNIEENALVEGDSVVVDKNGVATLDVPAQSVTTFHIEGVTGVSDSAPQFTDGQTFQLTGLGSGLPLTATDEGKVELNKLSPKTAASQLWTVTSVSGEGTNHQEIVLTNGEGKVLREADGGVTAVTPKGDPAADPASRWIPGTTNGTDFSLQPTTTGKALDVNGQASKPGSRVGLYEHSGGSHQRWLLQDTTREGFKPITLNVEAGTTPALPEQVTPIYAYGPGQPVDVTWDTKGVDWDTVGTVTLTGSGVDSYGREFDDAELNVEVGGATSTDPTSMTVRQGISLDIVKGTAPATVRGQVGASENRFDLDVTWDWSALSDESFADLGVVKVPGTATGAGASVDATLNVLVTESTESNIAPDSQPSATDTQTEYETFDVADTINGVTSDKAWSNWKSGDKNPEDTLTYEWDGDHELTSAKIFFMKDGTDSWPTTITPEYRDGTTGEWSALDPVQVSAGKDDPAPVVELELGVQADAVRFVMTAREDTHMIVSETEVYSPAASASSYSELARLSVGGSDVEGFDPETLDYEVTYEGFDYPTVSAVALDREASVEITQPTADEPTATIVVTSADGTSTTTYTVAITLVDPPIPPSVEFVDLSEGAAVEPGQSVSAIVSNAEPGTEAELAWHSEPVSLATGQVDSDGSAELAGVIPEDTSTGMHALVVSLDGEELGRVNVTVISDDDGEPGTDPTDPGTDPSDPGTDPSDPGDQPSEPGSDPSGPSADPSANPSGDTPGEMPNTGANAAPALVGLLLAAAGVAVLWARKAVK